MKTIILSVLFAFSTLAFAQPSDRDQAKEWTKKNAHFNPQQNESLGSATGKGCKLNFGASGPDQFLWVVVEDTASNKSGDDRYVGASASHDSVQVTNNSYTFFRYGAWGSNESKFNKIVVGVDGNGKPLHAKGESDLQTIDCNLN